jgi:hypothetical protein
MIRSRWTDARRIRRLAHYLVCLVTAAWLLSPRALPAQDPGERQALKDYLVRHQLDQLHSSLLETEMLKADDPEARRQAARTLAELYARQMVTREDQFDALSERLDQLVREFPEAIPDNTQIEIAWGRYRRAKNEFERWTQDRGNVTLQQQVNDGFAGLLQRVSDATARLESGVRDGSESRPGSPDTVSLISRYEYLASWARYYRSLASSDTETRRRLLRAAEDGFLELLEVSDTRQLTTISPTWWALNSEWTCRLLLGLGMTCQALEQRDSARYCFSLLQENRVPLAIRNSQRVWRFHSFLFPGQLEDAADFVRELESAGQVWNDVGLWSAVALAGITWPEASPLAANLTSSGLGGLARANEFGIVDEIHSRFPGVRVTGQDFFARWMDGYAALKSADHSGGETLGQDSREDLRRAVHELRTALDTESSASPVYRARCRYHLGFALYLDLNSEEAVEQFRQAATVLRRPDPELAEHATWMQCQALNRLAAGDSAWSAALRFALSDFQRQFPDSRYASEAAFLRVLNQLHDGSLPEALTALQSIGPDDPNYRRALFETCRLSHRGWNETSDDEQKSRLAVDTLEAASRYLEESGTPPSGYAAMTRWARVCLLAADVCLQQDQTAQAADWLERCADLQPSMQLARETGSDYYFLLMNLAARLGDNQQEAEASEWLLKNTTDPDQLRAARISRARQLDQRFRESLAGGQPPDNRQQDQLMDAYQQLVDEYLADEAGLAGDPVIQTALYRLAEIQALSGRVAEARDSFARLQRAVPSELAYIQGLARVEMQLGNGSVAAGHWQTIAAGLSAGSDPWLEAKYNLVRCLQQDQPAGALILLKQVRVLCPRLPEPWETRFSELESRLAEVP